ncbi:hypothetical protein P4H61_05875 [Paenibacillus peoriae]|uniref:hypothetical protein n=1 Tax=Paenibacillus peoriae TaxID=59893 RepID=UPI00026C5686|nr:hypothetical protein [Paenibacillus peoriae]MEC0181022.1 hypothetical protein [Paenibacillus peoriae]
MYIIGFLIEELDHDYDEVTVTIGYKSIEYKTFVEKYLSMQASLAREEWYCFWEKEESINFEIFTGYPNIVDDKEIGLSGGSYGYYTENYQRFSFFEDNIFKVRQEDCSLFERALEDEVIAILKPLESQFVLYNVIKKDLI